MQNFSLHKIFICMTKMTKFLIVRISETQHNQLSETILTEQKNKSTIVRAALDHYMGGTDVMDVRQNPKNNKNKKSL